MGLLPSSLQLLLLSLAVAGLDTAHVVRRDVCVLGGGASGTYAAVRLRDRGHSVVVVERDGLLGGHARTKHLAHGRFVDYGVEGVFGDAVSRAFMRRLSVRHKALLPASFDTDHVDFRTSRKLDINGSFLDALDPLLEYRRAIARFGFLRDGLYGLPDPVPDELLRPFGDFVRDNVVEKALPIVFAFAAALGNVLQAPLRLVLQSFGLAHVDAVLAGYITPVKGMGELYRRAAAALGPENILFQTSIVNVTRSGPGPVSIVVVSSDGRQQRIEARKLLVAIPPTGENMDPVDLDAQEKALFENLQWNNYYAAVINDSGIPDGLNVANADPTQPLQLPVPPCQWQLEYMDVPGYLATKLTADRGFSPQDAKGLILADINRMAGVYPIANPSLIAFADHSPTNIRASNELIRDGFYRKLYASQGRRNTYYTGRAFCSDYSSLLWAYTDKVIEGMMAS